MTVRFLRYSTAMLYIRWVILGVCFFCLTTNSSFAQEDFSFEVCEVLAKQENPRVIQGLDNWLFGSTDLISDSVMDDEAVVQLKKLKTALEYRGIEVIFVLLPSRAMMHYDKLDLSKEIFKTYDLEEAINSYENALKVLNDIGFHTPNVYEYLLANAQGQDYAFERDSHWLPHSAAYTAELVKEALEKNDAKYQLIHSDFEVQLKLITERYSDLARAVNISCGTAIPSEPQEIYELVSLQTQSDLLTNTETSVVPLWGTSFSRTSNFAEFLQAELDVEIANYAYGAAGLWRSLRQYFLETDTSSSAPELAIWEIPYRYYEEFNSVELYQELIPTIYGLCESDLAITPMSVHSISAQHVNLFDETVTKLENWDAVRLSTTQYSDPLTQTSGQEVEKVTKLIFNGEKDPWLSYEMETLKPLAGEFYEFSVWLWTDEDQPKKAALYMFSGKGNVAITKLTLTTEPQLYTVFHGFSAEEEKTAMTLRIDGIQGAWSENSKGQYLYAASPVLYKSGPIQLFASEREQATIQDDSYYSYIEFTDKSIVDFQLFYEYSDDSFISVDIKRDKHTVNEGKYFYEIPSQPLAFLKNLYLKGLPSLANGKVSSQLCKTP